MNEVVNKTMDRADLDSASARRIAGELNALIVDLHNRDLRISSWYGLLEASADVEIIQRLNRGIDYRPLPGAADDDRFPWFRYWEIAWVCQHVDFKPGEMVLDLGGSSSLFSYYLASRGLRVTTIDLNQKLVDNANSVAKALDWDLHNARLDIRDLRRPGSSLADKEFDHVTSICVFEHIPATTRVDASVAMAEAVDPGGTVSLTFDYLNPALRARINSPADVRAQFVAPTGLVPRGNPEFLDNGERYLLHPAFHPDAMWSKRVGDVVKRRISPLALIKRKRRNDYTFGSLFLERAT
jgi:2-polyprenyl-3-methyl-5-hydroxy-6-metoxy-1,4-benzoquinol methylase